MKRLATCVPSELTLKFLQPLKKEPVYPFENGTIQLDYLNIGFKF